MLKNKKVSEVMTKNVFTTNPDEDVVFAFEKLMKNKVSALPVLDEDGKMIGIVTASDLGYNLILDNYKLGTKVSSVMVKNVTSVSPEESLYDAICTMEENAPGGSIVNQLPVLENGTLVGIISDGDIIKALK
ncbi:MAG: CBS domain-containing protein [Methanobrevibacter arboriphilus]|jgi:CBS domain-containing protein|uniref:CBS domain-containing protein n=1 Tax=Methanobrevibacter arboriphilus TaxID=39441 RepID=A0A843ALM0_METAZ|nr:CBS domain-containing protein [Methanobrevibacter arboriphilus]MBF4468229.1 CBS domain-containing protein [Methanobrevibacter arboriphilus]MCC7562055.1 CBS domain-containing protein [Methanobrevibacter arboriphilus]